MLNKILNLFKSKPKIIWQYEYIQNHNEVHINDVIDTTPDEYNRWQIIGYFKIKTKVLTEYKYYSKTVLVPCVCIQKYSNNLIPEYKFYCEFPYIRDANIGYSKSFIYGETPNEVMIKVQEAFEKTYKCFRNII